MLRYLKWMMLTLALVAPTVLPGCAARQEMPTTAAARPTPPAPDVSQPSPSPATTPDPEFTGEGGVVGGTVSGVMGGVVGGNNTVESVRLFSAGMTRPEKLSGPTSPYTQEAIAARTQGLVIAKCVVTKEGALTSCRVIKPIADMVDPVLMSLYQSRYKPVTVQGQPEVVDYTFNVRLKLPGTASDLENPAWLATQLEEELRLKARFLCAYDLLEAPVPSRLPRSVDAASLIRHEDLDLVLRNPSRVPRTELDTPNLHAFLASYVSCEPTEVRVSGDSATVSLKRDAPSWEKLPRQAPEVLSSEKPLAERLDALARWVRENGAVRRASTHQLRFVRTPQGWRADYGLASARR